MKKGNINISNDDFDFDDEMFPLDDSVYDDDDDLGGFSFNPDDDGPTGVKGFFVNTLKSVKGVGLDFVDEFLPAVSENVDEIKSAVSETKDKFLETKDKFLSESSDLLSSFVKKDSKDSEKTTNNIFKETLGNIRKGKFYVSERDKPMDMNAFLNDSDDGDNDSDSSDDGEDEDTSGKMTTKFNYRRSKPKTRNVININTDNAGTLNAMSEIESNSVMAHANINSKLMSRNIAASNDNAFATINILKNISDNVEGLSDFLTHYGKTNLNAALEFDTKALAFLSDQRALLKDIVRSTNASIGIREKNEDEEIDEDTNKSLFNLGGSLDFSKYVEHIKGNAADMFSGSSFGMGFDQINSLKSMLGKDSGMSGMLDMKSMAKSMVKSTLFNSLVGEQTKSKLGKLNELFGSIGGTVATKANNWKDSGNPLLSFIGQLLGTNGEGLDKTFNLNKQDLYEQSPLDVKTKETINVTIPEYLSKILDGVTGLGETYFDHEAKQIRTKSSFKDRYEMAIKNQMDSNPNFSLGFTEAEGSIKNRNKKLSNPIDESIITQAIDLFKRNLIESKEALEPNLLMHSDDEGSSYRDKMFKGFDGLVNGDKSRSDELKNIIGSELVDMSREANPSDSNYMVQRKNNEIIANITSSVLPVSQSIENMAKEFKEYGVKIGALTTVASINQQEKFEKFDYDKEYSSLYNSDLIKGNIIKQNEAKIRLAQANIEQFNERTGFVDIDKSSLFGSNGNPINSSTSEKLTDIYELLVKGIVVYPNNDSGRLNERMAHNEEISSKIQIGKDAVKASKTKQSDEIENLRKLQSEEAYNIKQLELKNKALKKMGVNGDGILSMIQTISPLEHIASGLVDTLSGAMGAIMGKGTVDSILDNDTLGMNEEQRAELEKEIAKSKEEISTRKKENKKKFDKISGGRFSKIADKFDSVKQDIEEKLSVKANETIIKRESNKLSKQQEVREKGTFIQRTMGNEIYAKMKSFDSSRIRAYAYIDPDYYDSLSEKKQIQLYQDLANHQIGITGSINEDTDIVIGKEKNIDKDDRDLIKKIGIEVFEPSPDVVDKISSYVDNFNIYKHNTGRVKNKSIYENNNTSNWEDRDPNLTKAGYSNINLDEQESVINDVSQNENVIAAHKESEIAKNEYDKHLKSINTKGSKYKENSSVISKGQKVLEKKKEIEKSIDDINYEIDSAQLTIEKNKEFLEDLNKQVEKSNKDTIKAKDKFDEYVKQFEIVQKKVELSKQVTSIENDINELNEKKNKSTSDKVKKEINSKINEKEEAKRNLFSEIDSLYENKEDRKILNKSDSLEEKYNENKNDFEKLTESYKLHSEDIDKENKSIEKDKAKIRKRLDSSKTKYDEFMTRNTELFEKYDAGKSENDEIDKLTKSLLDNVNKTAGKEEQVKRYEQIMSATKVDKWAISKIKSSSEAGKLFLKDSSKTEIDELLASGDKKSILEFANNIKSNNEGTLSNEDKLSYLDPKFGGRLQGLLADPAIKDSGVSIKDSARSPLKQFALYSKGRVDPEITDMLLKAAGIKEGINIYPKNFQKEMGPDGIVARSLSSNHLTGRAVDLDNGKADWELIARTAANYGIKWAGNNDKPHFEYDTKFKTGTVYNRAQAEDHISKVSSSEDFYKTSGDILDKYQSDPFDTEVSGTAALKPNFSRFNKLDSSIWGANVKDYATNKKKITGNKIIDLILNIDANTKRTADNTESIGFSLGIPGLKGTGLIGKIGSTAKDISTKVFGFAKNTLDAGVELGKKGLSGVSGIVDKYKGQKQKDTDAEMNEEVLQKYTKMELITKYGLDKKLELDPEIISKKFSKVQLIQLVLDNSKTKVKSIFEKAKEFATGKIEKAKEFGKNRYAEFKEIAKTAYSDGKEIVKQLYSDAKGVVDKGVALGGDLIKNANTLSGKVVNKAKDILIGRSDEKFDKPTIKAFLKEKGIDLRTVSKMSDADLMAFAKENGYKPEVTTSEGLISKSVGVAKKLATGIKDKIFNKKQSGELKVGQFKSLMKMLKVINKSILSISGKKISSNDDDDEDSSDDKIVKLIKKHELDKNLNMSVEKIRELYSDEEIIKMTKANKRFGRKQKLDNIKSNITGTKETLGGKIKGLKDKLNDNKINKLIKNNKLEERLNMSVEQIRELYSDKEIIKLSKANTKHERSQKIKSAKTTISGKIKGFKEKLNENKIVKLIKKHELDKNLNMSVEKIRELYSDEEIIKMTKANKRFGRKQKLDNIKSNITGTIHKGKTLLGIENLDKMEYEDIIKQYELESDLDSSAEEIMKTFSREEIIDYIKTNKIKRNAFMQKLGKAIKGGAKFAFDTSKKLIKRGVKFASETTGKLINKGKDFAKNIGSVAKQAAPYAKDILGKTASTAGTLLKGGAKGILNLGQTGVELAGKGFSGIKNGLSNLFGNGIGIFGGKFKEELFEKLDIIDDDILIAGGKEPRTREKSESKDKEDKSSGFMDTLKEKLNEGKSGLSSVFGDLKDIWSKKMENSKEEEQSSEKPIGIEYKPLKDKSKDKRTRKEKLEDMINNGTEFEKENARTILEKMGNSGEKGLNVVSGSVANRFNDNGEEEGSYADQKRDAEKLERKERNDEMARNIASIATVLGTSASASIAANGTVQPEPNLASIMMANYQNSELQNQMLEKVSENTAEMGGNMSKGDRFKHNLKAAGGFMKAAALPLAGLAAAGAGVVMVGKQLVNKGKEIKKNWKGASGGERVGMLFGSNGASNYDSEGNKITDKDQKAGARFGLNQAGHIAGFLKILNKIFQSKAMLKSCEKLGGEVVTKFIGKIPQMIAKVAGPGLAKVTSKVGAFVAKASNPIGWGVLIAQLSYDVISGAVEANRMFGLGKGIKPTGVQRLIAGLSKVISGQLTFGLIPPETLAGLLWKLMGSSSAKAQQEAGKEFVKQRAKILEVDADRLTEFETMTWTERLFGGDKKRASILGFMDKKIDAKESVENFKNWFNKLYQPLDEIFKDLKKNYGGKVDKTQRPDDTEGIENQDKFRSEYLKVAADYKSKNGLSGLGPLGIKSGPLKNDDDVVMSSNDYWENKLNKNDVAQYQEEAKATPAIDNDEDKSSVNSAESSVGGTLENSGSNIVAPIAVGATTGIANIPSIASSQKETSDVKTPSEVVENNESPVTQIDNKIASGESPVENEQLSEDEIIKLFINAKHKVDPERQLSGMKIAGSDRRLQEIENISTKTLLNWVADSKKMDEQKRSMGIPISKNEDASYKAIDKEIKIRLESFKKDPKAQSYQADGINYNRVGDKNYVSNWTKQANEGVAKFSQVDELNSARMGVKPTLGSKLKKGLSSVGGFLSGKFKKLKELATNFAGDVKDKVANSKLGSIARSASEAIAQFVGNRKETESQISSKFNTPEGQSEVIDLANNIVDKKTLNQQTSSSSLSPQFAERIEGLLKDKRVAGHGVRIRESYRAPATQLAYYSKGRAPSAVTDKLMKIAGFKQGINFWDPSFQKPGDVITWTLGSNHFSGTAADLEAGDLGYDKLGEIAREYGIDWGGTWSTPDKPHFEMGDSNFKMSSNSGSGTSISEAAQADGINYENINERRSGVSGKIDSKNVFKNNLISSARSKTSNNTSSIFKAAKNMVRKAEDNSSRAKQAGDESFVVSNLVSGKFDELLKLSTEGVEIMDKIHSEMLRHNKVEETALGNIIKGLGALGAIMAASQNGGYSSAGSGSASITQGLFDNLAKGL